MWYYVEYGVDVLMLANERHSKIRAALTKTGAVTVAELAKAFGVSDETVRRDLLALEREGILSRVHGGAIAVATIKPAGEFSVRIDEHRREKNELSQLAAELIEEGDIIAVDAGTTALEFADVIKDKFKNLTVITHSLGVFNILSHAETIQTVLVGGNYDKGEDAFWGHLTAQNLRSLHVAKAFIFPTGISLSCGISDFHLKLADVQHTLLSIADKIIVLADSSKFEKTSLCKLCDLKPEHIYVTDKNLPDTVYDLYRENNITLLKGNQ